MQRTTTLHASPATRAGLLTGEDLDSAAGGRELKALEIGLPSERLTEFEILDTPALSGPAAPIPTATFAFGARWQRALGRKVSASSGRRFRAAAGAMPCSWPRTRMLSRNPSDATKIEWRLRAAAGDMFRDVILVSATDAGKSRRTNGRPSDASAITLLGQVRVWAAEIRDRRARKVEKIVRRLARLTFHQLARARLKSPEASILRDWEADCARLLGGLGGAPDDLGKVMHELLRRFAQVVGAGASRQYRA